MIHLTFKDVSQGDSIILEWEDEQLTKFGIIDCRKLYSKNPVLKHLENKRGQKEIEFLFISHCHQDHYSGLNDLISFCEANNIIIKNFISTFHPTQFQYFEIVNSRNENLRLAKLFKRINKILDDEGIIIDAYPALNYSPNFDFKNYNITCLYPRLKDYTKLGNDLNSYINKKRKSKPDLNFISTIIKIISEDNLILLTSDSIKESLDYCERKDEDLKIRSLSLGQVPHHGSKNNHNLKFWKQRKKFKDCPAVISSGSGKDNLPDHEVVKDFNAWEYKIFSTNFINGIREFITGDEPSPKNNNTLNLFSSLEEEYSLKTNDRFVGDKKFDLNQSPVKYLSKNP